ncbi:MAG: hypothetical protein VX751_00505 [Pseudomonadota bacterium]|nr:hypothetical protein [Pseudomonadota bacterium]
MNSFNQARGSIMIGIGPSYAQLEIWQDLRSKPIVPTKIVSLATSQRFNLTLILRDHYLRGY